MSFAHVRPAPKHRRFKRDGFNDAAGVIADLTPGSELYGFTKGQFSLFELLQAILNKTGPADVVISTWTASDADLKDAYAFLECGKIASIKLIVDRSFPTRQPEYCEVLRRLFGEDVIRLTRTHAKFAMIRNGQWNIVVRTSMNLNHNPRCETFEISDDPALYEFHQSFVDELFAVSVAETGLSSSTPAIDGVFQGLTLGG